MSQFRKLVEDIVKPQEPTYTYLTPEMQTMLHKKVEDEIDDIDPSELESAHWDDNPYMVEPELAMGSGRWEYDEDEMWNKACESYIKILKADKAVECLWDLIPEDKQDDDEYNNALTAEAIDYIEKQER